VERESSSREVLVHLGHSLWTELLPEAPEISEWFAREMPCIRTEAIPEWLRKHGFDPALAAECALWAPAAALSALEEATARGEIDIRTSAGKWVWRSVLEALKYKGEGTLLERARTVVYEAASLGSFADRLQRWLGASLALLACVGAAVGAGHDLPMRVWQRYNSSVRRWYVGRLLAL
jgi:hypothetical protein